MTLTKTNEKIMRKRLENWRKRWQSFLLERNYDSITGKWPFVHRRTRRAYFSLIRNLSYLFTYQRYPDLEIPNTTNSCDGSFSHWKRKISLHRGFHEKNRKIMVDYFLEGSQIQN